MIKTSRAVVVGGYVASERLLGPVADALCKRFGFADADVFEFPDVIDDPSDLQRAVRGQMVFEHSAGLLAVAQCRGMDRVVAINSPEPRRMGKLVVASLVKGANLWAAAITGPHRRGSARVATDNIVQAGMHAGLYLRYGADVSSFSTDEQLRLMAADGIATARIDTTACEFFGPHPLRSWDEKDRSVVLPGPHDQVLINPDGFVELIPEEALA